MTTAVPAAPASRSSAVRSTMQSNRRVGTKPERELRSELHRAGLRFRKDHRLDLPGGRVRPDVVFTRLKLAVFMDGCFWHRCPEHAVEPKSNEWYWLPKLQRNVERDRQADHLLRETGWKVVRLWEHTPVETAVEEVFHAVLERRLQVGVAPPYRPCGAPRC